MPHLAHSRATVDPFIAFPLLFDGKVSLIYHAYAREFVLSLLPGINGEDLIFFLLVKTEVTMIFNRPVRQLTRTPDETALLRSFFAHE